MAKTPIEAALAIAKKQRDQFKRTTTNKAGLSGAIIGANNMVAILESGPCAACVSLCASVAGRENIGCQGKFVKPGDLARRLTTQMLFEITCEEFKPVGNEQVVNKNGVLSYQISS